MRLWPMPTAVTPVRGTSCTHTALARRAVSRAVSPSRSGGAAIQGLGSIERRGWPRVLTVVGLARNSVLCSRTGRCGPHPGSTGRFTKSLLDVWSQRVSVGSRLMPRFTAMRSSWLKPGSDIFRRTRTRLPFRVLIGLAMFWVAWLGGPFDVNAGVGFDAGSCRRAVAPSPSIEPACLTRASEWKGAPRPALHLAMSPAREPQATVSEDCAHCPTMIAIPAGRFVMGITEAGRDRVRQQWTLLSRLMDSSLNRSLPASERSVSAFEMSRDPITVGQFRAFIRATSHKIPDGCVNRLRKYRTDGNAAWDQPGFPQGDEHPVVCVNVEDAMAYIEWLDRTSASSGSVASGRFRLPTEEEWEYAARAGTDSLTPWGDQLVGADCSACKTADFAGPYRKGTLPVSATKTNQFGLRSVLGNSWNWTHDCASSSQVTMFSRGAIACGETIMKGGSWGSSPTVQRSDARSTHDASERTNFIGFRVVR